LSVGGPEKVLKNIKKWIKAHGKFNIEEVFDPTTYFTLKLTSKQHPEALAFSVIYSMDSEPANTMMVGWGWMLRDIDIKAYASYKDCSVKLNIIKSIDDRCHSKGLLMSFEPDEYNLEGMRVWKNLQIEGLTKQEFMSTLRDEAHMFEFVMGEFEKYNMSRAGFDPLVP
jgi:hypothetical protein